MQTNQPIHEHKTMAQKQRVEHHIERTLEEQRLARLKASLQAKLENHSERVQAA